MKLKLISELQYFSPTGNQIQAQSMFPRRFNYQFTITHGGLTVDSYKKGSKKGWKVRK